MIYSVKVSIIKTKTKTRVYVFITLHILYPIKLHEDIHTSVFENYTLSLFLSFRKKKQLCFSVPKFEKI